MTPFQKTIKSLALVLAIFLTVIIIGSIITASATILTLTGIIEFPASEKIEFTESYENITSLDISLKAGELTIEKGDTFKLTANTDKGFSPEVRDGTLKIREKGFNFFNLFIWNNHSKYTLTIPEDAAFEDVKIDLGAGKASLSYINTQNLKINAGAGKITASNLTSNKARVDGGVGEFTLIDCSLKDLSLECGVGKLTYRGTMTGECKIDSGVGAVDIHLTGSKQDYEINISTGIGKLTVDGEKQSDGITINKGAVNVIDIDGGIGDTSIEFAE